MKARCGGLFVSLQKWRLLHSPHFQGIQLPAEAKLLTAERPSLSMAAQRSREGVENIIKKEWIRFYNKCYNNALLTRVNLDAPPPPALGLSIRQHHRSVAPCGPLESEVGNREALGWIRFDTLIEWERERQEFSKLLLSFFFFFCCFCSNLGFFPMSATHMQDPTLPILLVTLFG